MLKNILEAENFKDVLSESTKADIERAFNEAVEIKASEIAASEISLKEIELTEQFLEAKSELFETVAEKIDEFLKAQVAEVLSKINEKLDLKINEEKTNLILNVFETQLLATGKNIVEQISDSENTSKAEIEDLKAKLLESKSKIQDLKNEILINEMSEGLTILEKDKFILAARLLNLSSNAREKLNTLKESVISSTDAVSAKETVITESVEVKKAVDYSRF